MYINKRKGFTLVELVIAIAIISAALLALLGVMNVSVLNSANPGVRKQAVLSAESLMEEILSKPVIKPTGGFAGPYTLANRSQFDTVSDYNGLSIPNMSDISGTAISGLSNYSAAITTTNQAIGGIAATDSQLVTITVTGPKDTFVLKGYRINYEN